MAAASYIYYKAKTTEHTVQLFASGGTSTSTHEGLRQPHDKNVRWHIINYVIALSKKNYQAKYTTLRALHCIYNRERLIFLNIVNTIYVFLSHFIEHVRAERLSIACYHYLLLEGENKR